MVIHAVILHVLIILTQTESRIKYLWNKTYTRYHFFITFNNGNALP
jgi:hypothetical protein